MQASDSHDALKIALNQIFIEKGFKATKEEFKHSISCSLFTCKTISIKNHLIVAASSDDKLHLLDLLVNHFICSNVVYPVYYVDAFRSSDLLIEFNSLVDRDIIQLVAPGLEHGDVPTVAVAPTVVPTVVHTITPTTVPPTSTRMVDPRYSLIDHSHPPFSIGDFDRDPFASSPFDPRFFYLI